MDTTSTDEPLVVNPADSPIRGSIVPPPDKSITHRALFFAALNTGVTRIANPSRAADPRSTFDVLTRLGYDLRENPYGWEMHGAAGLGDRGSLALDCGNSGTTARFAAGFLTGEHGRFTLFGDESLMRRPMERVAVPLRMLGAQIETTGGVLPARIEAGVKLAGLRGDASGLNVGSAQVHGAVVLAGLRSRNGVAVLRTRPMRDHTIRMALAFGARIHGRGEPGAIMDYVEPGIGAGAIDVVIPGDISSAAFMVAAALLVPGSAIRIDGVGLNPTRTAFLDALVAMGADVSWYVTNAGIEPVGAIEAAYSPHMHAITLGPDGAIHVAEMIDELPLLALVAARATGLTTVHGAAELRVKESDRIAATAAVLRSLGIEMAELRDGFKVEGVQRIVGGAEVDHHGDHRLCMIAAIAGLAAELPVTIPDPGVAAVSYPAFWSDLRRVAGLES